MVEVRKILEEISIINKTKSELWHNIYEGTLDQDKCNLFTRIASNVYSRFVTGHEKYLHTAILLDNDCICKFDTLIKS